MLEVLFIEEGEEILKNKLRSSVHPHQPPKIILITTVLLLIQVFTRNLFHIALATKLARLI